MSWRSFRAIGRQTARGVDSLDEFTTLFDARLTALARAQNLLVEPGADDLMAFVNRAIEPFDSNRFRISGARLPVPPDHAPAVALMIYELATNAMKHGALSVPEGLVLVGWRTTGEHLKILWQERGGTSGGCSHPTRFWIAAACVRSPAGARADDARFQSSRIDLRDHTPSAASDTAPAFRDRRPRIGRVAHTWRRASPPRPYH